MFFFDGCKCPYCGKLFEHGDDVVACPVCGAPHHRECYKEHGACAFEQEHENGYIWEREPVQKTEPADKNVCPVCNAENPAGGLWCKNCGAEIATGRSADPDMTVNSGNAAHSAPDYTSGGSWQSDNGYYSVGFSTTISDSELIDDVPAGDLKRYIKSTSYYYVPLFASFVRYGKKASFNLLAFFLHGVWFLSRKMYALGGIILGLQVAVFAFQTYCMKELDELMQVYLDGDMEAAYALVGELMVERPVLMYTMVLSSVLYYGILFVSGLFGNWFYKNHCIRKVKKIKSISRNAEEYNKNLDLRGGTALPLAVGCSVLYFAVRMLVQKLIIG